MNIQMIRIGVLGTASIAERRMIPALLKCPGMVYAGVAIATREETGTDCSEEAFLPVWQRKEEKSKAFQEKFGGETVIGYEAMLGREDIDAVYIPLPPALHFRWILSALRHGKHVIAEKPMTVSEEQTRILVEEAESRGLALFENYGFVYHNQMTLIRETIASGKIGDLRLVRAAFCFPHRDESDFRYNKALGGGALLDCGGYTIKAATEMLGSTAKVVCANLVTTPGHEVDIYGSATLQNDAGLCAQVSFGMDNAYLCEIEVIGSTGSIKATRAFTAPDGFNAPVILRSGNETEELFAADDQFLRVLEQFGSLGPGLPDPTGSPGQSLPDPLSQAEFRRKKEYANLLLQSRLVDGVKGFQA